MAWKNSYQVDPRLGRVLGRGDVPNGPFIRDLTPQARSSPLTRSVRVATTSDVRRLDGVRIVRDVTNRDKSGPDRARIVHLPPNPADRRAKTSDMVTRRTAGGWTAHVPSVRGL
jgi:hypothetical protein